MEKKQKNLVTGMFIYKLFINTVRLIGGFVLLYTNFNLYEASKMLFGKVIITHPQPTWLVYFLTLVLIVFSSIEIFLTILMKLNNILGVEGLFIMSLVWIPIELLVISRFLRSHGVFSLIIDAAILYVLFVIIKGFKKKIKAKHKRK